MRSEAQNLWSPPCIHGGTVCDRIDFYMLLLHAVQYVQLQTHGCHPLLASLVLSVT